MLLTGGGGGPADGGADGAGEDEWGTGGGGAADAGTGASTTLWDAVVMPRAGVELGSAATALGGWVTLGAVGDLAWSADGWAAADGGFGGDPVARATPATPAATAAQAATAAFTGPMRCSPTLLQAERQPAIVIQPQSVYPLSPGNSARRAYPVNRVCRRLTRRTTYSDDHHRQAARTGRPDRVPPAGDQRRAATRTERQLGARYQEIDAPLAISDRGRASGWPAVYQHRVLVIGLAGRQIFGGRSASRADRRCPVTGSSAAADRPRAGLAVIFALGVLL
jgi:hypothetical protein